VYWQHQRILEKKSNQVINGGNDGNGNRKVVNMGEDGDWQQQS